MNKVSKVLSPHQKKSKITTKFIYYLKNQLPSTPINSKIEITSLVIPSKSYEKYVIQAETTQLNVMNQSDSTTSGVLSKSNTDGYYEDSPLANTFQDTYALNSSASIFTIDDDDDTFNSMNSSLTNVTPLTPIEVNTSRMKRNLIEELKKKYGGFKEETPTKDTTLSKSKKTSPRRLSFKNRENKPSANTRKTNDYVHVNYSDLNLNKPESLPNADNTRLTQQPLSKPTQLFPTPEKTPQLKDPKKNEIVDAYATGKTQELLSNGIKKISYKNGTVKYVYPESMMMTSPTTCLSPQSIHSIASPKSFSSHFESKFKCSDDYLRSTIQFENGDLVDLYKSGTEIYFLRQQDLIIEKYLDNKEVYRYLDTDTIEIRYADGYTEFYKNDDMQEVHLIYRDD